MCFLPPQFIKNKGTYNICMCYHISTCLLIEYWEKHPKVSEMKLLQDKGMQPHSQEIENVLEDSSSGEEVATLGPLTNRFNALCDEEDS